MLAAPSVRATVNSKGWVIPGSPALPRNRAYRDQRKAALTPRETSVSMVAVPSLRFFHAATWKGSAPQTTTGAASAKEAHCQWVNCSAGIIAIAMTGTDSNREISARFHSAVLG